MHRVVCTGSPTSAVNVPRKAKAKHTFRCQQDILTSIEYRRTAMKSMERQTEGTHEKCRHLDVGGKLIEVVSSIAKYCPSRCMQDAAGLDIGRQVQRYRGRHKAQRESTLFSRKAELSMSHYLILMLTIMLKTYLSRPNSSLLAHNYNRHLAIDYLTDEINVPTVATEPTWTVERSAIVVHDPRLEGKL